VGEGSKVKKLVSPVVFGILTGLIYYLVYVMLLPTLFSKILPGTVVLETPISWLLAFILFTSISLANSLLKEHPISLPLRFLSKVLGALIVLTLLNFGVVRGEITMGGTVLEYSMDISLPLYVIVLFSMLIFP
jgi:hypothetical protein